jgi:hypothetical protein
MRSHITEQGEALRLRFCVGGQKNPHQFTHARLEARQAALLRTHLRTTYAKWEARFDPADLSTDYALLRGHRWNGTELVPDPEGQLSPEVDARFRLLLDLGVEQRYAQQLRLRRSHLGRVAETGAFMVPELGIADNKLSGIRLLSERQRVALALEMEAGVLQDLEDAYREGRITDYPLFPGKSLVGGRVPAGPADPRQPLDDRVITAWCRKLEEALGIEHVEGRAMRGWRRAFVDLYDGWTADDVVKSLITGHRHHRPPPSPATARRRSRATAPRAATSISIRQPPSA